MERPRPEVTVTDPRQPGALVAVEEPPPPRLGRRGAALLAAAALVGAVALFAADVVRDRREAVEQRRLDGVVEVALGPPGGGWTSSHDASTGTGTVAGSVQVVNHGPRPVSITSARLGSLSHVGVEALDTDDAEVLVLRRTVRCPADGSPPPPETEPQDLHLRLETPAGPREVTLRGNGLPIGSLDDSVQRACAYPPLRESVDLAGTVVAVEGRSAVVRVEVSNEGRRPVRLLSLVPARGLVVLTIDGDPAPMPVVLPPRRGREPSVRTLDLRLGVVCGALIGADPLRPFEELSAIVEEEDRSTITSVGAVSQDPGGQLRQLAGRTCLSG